MAIKSKQNRDSILLVADTPASLQLLISDLGKHNYDVRPVINGELAIESALALCPDLILLDINMPGIDGYEVCRRLKADSRTCDVPVIFISSMDESIDKVKAFAAGGVDYISKPFESEEVLARINCHLTLRKTQLRLEHEIDERKKVQDELVQHRQLLGKFVEERTLELAQKRLSLKDEVQHRQGVEAALQESEQRNFSLVEDGFDGVFIHQGEEVIFLNHQLADMLGGQTVDYLERPVIDMFAPEARAIIAQRILNQAKGTVAIDMVRTDGSAFRCEIFDVACKYQGDDARIVGVRDISARYQTEVDLRASEQKYSTLFHQFETLLDAISDPLVLLTVGMKPIWANKAYEQVCNELDCGPDSGLTLFHLDTGHGESPILRCFKQGDVIEGMITTPDKRIWGVKVFPLRGEKGVARQVIACAVDITEKIRLREEANRSGKLASIGELAAGVAHEINNPNAVILLNMPIIKDAFADAEKALTEYHRRHGELALAGIDYADMLIELPSLIGRVQESAERIKRIVEDLKNFVLGEVPKEFIDIDLNRVVEAAAQLLDNSIKRSTNHFSLQLTEDIPRIKGNFQKLEQVIINLIQNACQSLTAPSQQVSVSTRYDREQNMLVLQVSDQGCGIEINQLDRLTDPFYTTKRNSGGTGLGLSVSERILREHKAQIRIESKLGEGSIFSIFIPAVGGSD